MSQSGLLDPGRAADWDQWYVEHLRVMLTVPGIQSAQRFQTASSGYPPSLAMYSITGAEVFDDPYYRSVRGMEEWLPLIDRRYYRRNLFSGMERAPAVAADAFLLIADREREDPGLASLGLIWLDCVGIDRTTPVRGITVRGTAPAPATGLAVYRPATAFMVSGGGR